MLDISKAIETELVHLADPVRAKQLQRFFKTGPGEYGEGDYFLGISVPVSRSIVKKYRREATIEDALRLLDSKWHECRVTGAVLLVHQYQTGTDQDRSIIYREYIKQPGLNNWDIIDISAPKIVGVHLLRRSKAPLKKLAISKSIWKRRIGIVSTLGMIREGELEPTFEICNILMRDKHDLIHKACGWMLREAGKRDQRALEAFLDTHIRAMPRTMLRYAIEKFSEKKRKELLKIK